MGEHCNIARKPYTMAEFRQAWNGHQSWVKASLAVDEIDWANSARRSGGDWGEPDKSDQRHVGGLRQRSAYPCRENHTGYRTADAPRSARA